LKKILVLLSLCFILISGLYADTLVAYFSYTGEAQELAITVADVLDADLFQVVPSLSYTDEEVNRKNKDSRYAFEAGHPGSRPAFDGSIDASPYDTIVLVYPIWYRRCPNIMCTFVESLHLDGKKVVPLAVGKHWVKRSGKRLKKVADKGAIFVKAKRFNSDVLDQEIMNYLKSVVD